ncbi:hypothetical protein PCS_02514 [Desulfocurvibacter africanus PCS]|uniref:Uncharacterized protein n=1 Tax=Desulfocurvibacter africanus PCS TaxID=1262666 RepID=M5PR08_DESAF|nr:hypothetical protein PCS_02514 [Desulfocurvibacter africanus PCS]
MVNMDYPGPCPSCGAEGECEHRIKQMQSGEERPENFQSDVSPDRKRSDMDPHEIDKSERDIDK